jgi:predicted DNA-binding antitoxin AbrB/MazE fold protein
MSTVSATYVAGVFRPDQAVDLPENSRVQLIIQREGKQLSAQEFDELWNEFDRLAEEFPIQTAGPMPTRDELHERR